MNIDNFNTLFREFYVFYYKNINEEDYAVKAKVFFYNLKSYPEEQIKSLFMVLMSDSNKYMPNLSQIKERLRGIVTPVPPLTKTRIEDIRNRFSLKHQQTIREKLYKAWTEAKIYLQLKNAPANLW